MWSIQLGLVLVLCTVMISGKITEVKIEKFEIVPGSEDILTLENTIEQLNKTAFAVTAHYEQKVELDNSYNIQLIASLATRGDKYIEVYRSKPTPLCDFVQSQAAKLKTDMHMPDDVCPFAPMEFSLEREEFNAESLLAMGMPGKFKADVILTKAGAEKVRAILIIETK